MTDESALPSDAIELGHGTFYTKQLSKDGIWTGIYEWHKEPGRDYYSAGYIPFVEFDAMRGWHVISKEPLTLHPSLACNQCGHHGWVQNGKWVPA